jgi:hypothetical protein
MTREFFLLLLLAALWFLIAVAALLAILVLASRALAQNLMGLLAQLFGGGQGGVTDPEVKRKESAAQVTRPEVAQPMARSGKPVRLRR